MGKLARLALTVLAPATLAAQAQPGVERLLTAADVERVTGQKGVVRVPKPEEVDLGFLRRADSVVVVAVTHLAAIRDARAFAAEFGDDDNVLSLSGLGDEAVRFADPDYPPSIVFRKGAWTIQLSSGVDPTKGWEPVLSEAQLRELGKLILGRL